MKVLEGEFRFLIESDMNFHSSLGMVHCGDQVVRPSKDGKWQKIDFSLNHDLSRNFFSYKYAGNRKSPVYFTRWHQHNPGLAFAVGSHGKVLIDRIELIAKGEGKPFPTFRPAEVKVVERVADFENEKDMEVLFTSYLQPLNQSGPPPERLKMSDKMKGYKRPDYAAPLTRTRDGISGSQVLEFTKQFHEELSYVGAKLPQGNEANALQMKVHMEHLSKDNRTIVPLDFLLYVAADGEAPSFPWKRFEPPEKWKEDPAFGYTYLMGKDRASGISHAFYHARRGIKHKEWNTVIIPFADFVCAYGAGSMKGAYLEQKPIKPENIVAVLFATPHYPLGFALTKTMIDDIALVIVKYRPSDRLEAGE